MSSEYTRTFGRIERLKEIGLRYLLDRHAPRSHRRDLVAFVGDHISDEIRIAGGYEPDILAYLGSAVFPTLSPHNKRCLDIGANIGNHTLAFAEHFAEVIAFEPNPSAALVLEANLALNECGNVDVRRVGLSDHARRAELIVLNKNLGASRLEEHVGVGDAPDEIRARRTVTLEVGDRALAPGLPVAFIKVDVEGHEPAVLRGLATTLKRDRPIVMVEHLAASVDPVNGQTDVSQFLAGLGYTPYEISRVRVLPIIALDNVRALLAGRIHYRLERRDRFESRDHSAVLYFPGDTARGS